MVHSSRQTPHHKRTQKFIDQEMTVSSIPLFIPQGFEKIFITLYIIYLPYIAGLLFHFLYISGNQFDVFLSIYAKGSFMLTWAIGYEILAILALIYIIKMSLSSNPNLNIKDKQFQRQKNLSF